MMRVIKNFGSGLFHYIYIIVMIHFCFLLYHYNDTPLKQIAYAIFLFYILCTSDIPSFIFYEFFSSFIHLNTSNPSKYPSFPLAPLLLNHQNSFKTSFPNRPHPSHNFPYLKLQPLPFVFSSRTLCFYLYFLLQYAKQNTQGVKHFQSTHS